MNTTRLTQDGTNYANVVAEIPTPRTIDEVPATLLAIVETWKEFAAMLDAEVDKNPRNPIAALGAATAGGAIGVLRMVVTPTIENLAAAIGTQLAADLDEAAAAWERNAPTAVQMPAVEVDDNAAQTVHDALSAATGTTTDDWPDPAPFDVVTATQGTVVDELDAWAKRVGYVDTDPTPAAGIPRPGVDQ